IRAGRHAIRLAMIAAAFAGSLVVRDLRPGALFLAGAGLMTGIAILAITASRRAAVAAFAGATLAAAVIALEPAIGARVMAALESTAKTHTGHVFTVGHAYKLLDAGFYLNPQTPAA